MPLDVGKKKIHTQNFNVLQKDINTQTIICSHGIGLSTNNFAIIK